MPGLSSALEMAATSTAQIGTDSRAPEMPVRRNRGVRTSCQDGREAILAGQVVDRASRVGRKDDLIRMLVQAGLGDQVHNENGKARPLKELQELIRGADVALMKECAESIVQVFKQRQGVANSSSQ